MGIESGIGQKYGVAAPNVAVTANPSSALDLVTITAAAGIPVLIQRFVLTSNQSSAQAILLSVGVAASAGSGGTGTGITASAEPPSGAAATETLRLLNTTPATLTKVEAATFWQIFNGYEFNRKPGGLLLTPGQSLVLQVPTGAVTGGGFSISFEGEYVAVK